MWDLPGPGIEPVSPALAGGFLTTAPTGKSPNFILHSFTCSCPVFPTPLIEETVFSPPYILAFFVID